MYSVKPPCQIELSCTLHNHISKHEAIRTLPHPTPRQSSRGTSQQTIARPFHTSFIHPPFGSSTISCTMQIAYQSRYPPPRHRLSPESSIGIITLRCALPPLLENFILRAHESVSLWIAVLSQLVLEAATSHVFHSPVGAYDDVLGGRRLLWIG